MDVCKALKTFLIRSQHFRKSESLFISVSPPNLAQRMSKSAISYAIHSCIPEAYKTAKVEIPRGITAHSVRSTSTNAAFFKHSSMEDVCRAATWSSISTFTCQYKLNNYSSADASFGRRVLKHILQPLTLTEMSPPSLRKGGHLVPPISTFAFFLF